MFDKVNYSNKSKPMAVNSIFLRMIEKQPAQKNLRPIIVCALMAAPPLSTPSPNACC